MNSSFSKKSIRKVIENRLFRSMFLSRYILLVLFPLLGANLSYAQTSKKKEKFPSYFGFQYRPLFPTRFIGDPETIMIQEEFSTTLSQQMGFSFGGTIRAGITKLIAIETGINLTRRNFDVSMSIPDSNLFATNQLRFLSYDIPINGLVYVQLSEQFFMNASLGLNLSYKPTNVGILTLPGGLHSFTHTGRNRSKLIFGVNANFGFEYRTEKSGFFYIGGSGIVPFSPLFNMAAQYKNQGYTNTIYADVDGSFLAIDLKYFFPNIQSKGPQFKRGPIE
jgi:hypothetical protein